MAALPDLLTRGHFTREEVHRMEEQRLLTGRWELIAGELINKMGRNAPHSYVLNVILIWLAGLVGTRLRCQTPIEVPESEQRLNEPVPDLAVVREMKQDYAERHPRCDELALIIEVSDTSSRFDPEVKAALYARSGVPEYRVIDIARRRVVIHRQPEGETYVQVEYKTEQQSLSLEGSDLAISSFLPRSR
jgi:Uma2 family endonuclease